MVGRLSNFFFYRANAFAGRLKCGRRGYGNYVNEIFYAGILNISPEK
jgi:hypothetical protein